MPKILTTRAALRDLFSWMTGGDREGNPYMKAPVANAILALTRGKSRLDVPTRRPKAKIEGALYDLIELATVGDRHGNPYTKPAVRAASRALGGDGYDVPDEQHRHRHGVACAKCGV
jgi:hypothetical protein